MTWKISKLIMPFRVPRGSKKTKFIFKHSKMSLSYNRNSNNGVISPNKTVKCIPGAAHLGVIVKATSSRTNLDWGKTVKKLILNNIFIDHSVRFLTDFTIRHHLQSIPFHLIIIHCRIFQ